MTLMWLILCHMTLCATIVHSVEILTNQGYVRGKFEVLDGYGKVTKFLGIPYAKPPIGELRFAPPIKADWFMGKSVYNATYTRFMCHQPKDYLPLITLTVDPDVRFMMGEDCLQLNVYIPGWLKPSSKELLPVMVWIHGGSWQWGSGSHYDGRRLAIMGNVIVVTFNYRLGIFGSLPNGKKEGTTALRDQILALEWVKENIHSYRGDRNKVTIFGESAGGASVNYLSISPLARGLFKRAISESGLAASSWAQNNARREDMLETIKYKLDQTGCFQSLNVCLLLANTEKLVELTQFVISTLSLDSWAPMIDNEVIMPDFLDNPALIHPGLEVIIGSNTDEGGSMIEHICTTDTGEKCLIFKGIDFNSVRKWVAPSLDILEFESIGNGYNSFYPGPHEFGAFTLKAAAEFTTDWFQRIGNNRTASRFRDAGHNVYVYEFNLKSRDFRDIYITVDWSEDAQHTDELPYVFGLADNKEDKPVSKKMVQLWTNFTKGRPSSKWPLFGEEKNYIYFGSTNSKPGEFEIRKPLVSKRKEKFWHQWNLKFKNKGSSSSPYMLLILITMSLIFSLN